MIKQMMLKFCTYSGGVPGKDTCTGEGGAPLVCLDKDKDQFFAVGTIYVFLERSAKTVGANDIKIRC